MGNMFGLDLIHGHLRGAFIGIECHIQMTIHPYQYHFDLGHLYGAIKQARVLEANVHGVLKQFE
jgi:hypothetical protein